MTVHLRFLLQIFHLLQDCGMPEKTPDNELWNELYWMLEEHFEDHGVDPQ